MREIISAFLHGDILVELVASKKEIRQRLEQLLDNLEGEVYEQDFRDVCSEVADNYIHFTKKVK